MTARKATREAVKVGMVVRFTTCGGRDICGVVEDVNAFSMTIDGQRFATGGGFCTAPVDILREPVPLRAVKPGDVFEIDPALLPPVCRMLIQPFACKSRYGSDIEFISNGGGDVYNLCAQGIGGDRPVTLIHEPEPAKHTATAPPEPYPLVKLDDVKEWLQAGDELRNLDGRHVTVTKVWGGDVYGRVGNAEFTVGLAMSQRVRLISPRWESTNAGQLQIGDALVTYDGHVMRHTRVWQAPDEVTFVVEQGGWSRYLCGGYKVWRLVRDCDRDTERPEAPETERAPAPARVARRGRVVGIDGAELGTQPSPKTEPCPPPESPACRDCGRVEPRATPESGVPDPYRLQLLSTPDGPLCCDCASILLHPPKPPPKPEPSRLLRHNAGARYHMGDDVDATGVPSV